MKVISIMVNVMVMELIFMKMVQSYLAPLKTVFHLMDLRLILENGRTIYMLVILKNGKGMVKGHILGELVPNMLDNGKMVKEMAWVFLLIQVVKLKRVFGKMANTNIIKK